MKSVADLALANEALETLKRLKFVPAASAAPELKALYFKVRKSHVDQGAEQSEAERVISELRMALDQESINIRGAWDRAIDLSADCQSLAGRVRIKREIQASEAERGAKCPVRNWRDCRSCVSYAGAHFSEGNQGLSNSGKPFTSRAIRKLTRSRKARLLLAGGLPPRRSNLSARLFL